MTRRNSTNRQRKREGGDIAAFSRAVKTLSGGTCNHCGLQTTLTAHHLIPLQFCRDKPWRHHPRVNGRALCHQCHQAEHARPQTRASFSADIARADAEFDTIWR